MRMKKWAPTLRILPLAVLVLAATPMLYSAPTPGNSFVQHNLVSDIPGLASYTDPDLVNPWGVAFSPKSPFWISDNGTGLATLYNGTGVKQGLVVSVPPSGSAPTGQVFNGNPSDFGGSHFIFATEGGTIAAWSGGTSAAQVVDNTGMGSVFKGLATASAGGANYLYATDFHNGAIDVFDSTFASHSFGAGTFTDPTLPAGYAPFGIQTFGGNLYVTYALQDAAKHDDVACPGCGFVDVYDSSGNLLGRLISGGALNSPWGMAIAPTGFGSFTGDLLVGNFGNGWINVFSPTGTWLATLDDTSGNPIVIDGLWNIGVGNGGAAGSPNILYFTAGINGEADGLFGQLGSTPEPGTLTLLGSGFISLLGYGLRRGKRTS
jgi:uncharacterized protein (TIGR03118 family)